MNMILQLQCFRAIKVGRNINILLNISTWIYDKQDRFFKTMRSNKSKFNTKFVRKIYHSRGFLSKVSGMNSANITGNMRSFTITAQSGFLVALIVVDFPERSERISNCQA